MKKIKLFIFTAAIFVFSSVFAFEKDVFCEPSLIFPEIFPIESAKTFSYTVANELYDDSSALFLYLNSVDFTQEQFHVRYLYYLRTRQFLPAISLLMTMVSLNIYPDSFTNSYDEFFNLLQMAANNANEHSDKDSAFSLENPNISGDLEKYIKSVLLEGKNEPLTVEDLSEMMTAEFVLNLANVTMRRKMIGREAKITLKTVFLILATSFNAILSNLDNGVNLDSDPFFKDLFNTFVAMHKDEKQVLTSFLYNFVEKIYASKKSAGLYRYVILRQFGMIENTAESWLDFKDLKTAVKWIESIENKNEIPPFSSYFTRNDNACSYIDEKTKWIESMNHLGNESKKSIAHSLKLSGMIEQCNDLDYIGFKRDSENTENTESKPYPEWAIYLSAALGKVVNSEISENEAVKILEKGLFAAIFTIKPEGDEALESIYELLLYIYKSPNRDKILKSIFLKQINHGDVGKNTDLYQEAVKTLDEFLFY